MLAPYGIPGPKPSDAAAWLGPPLEVAFREWAGLSAQHAADAVMAFDEHARRAGPERTTPYPGMPELLAELDRAGLAQSTASAKDESQLRELLAREGLTQHFANISGARHRPGNPESKADIVGRALKRMHAEGIDVARPLLIGDRLHDVEAGRFHGIPVAFVAWGFGADAEAEGAATHVRDVGQLRAFLRVTAGTVH